jgi:hypothetical protein
MFTWYCGYLSARKRAISTTFVLTLLQMYLPDDAVAVSARNTSARQRSCRWMTGTAPKDLDAFQHGQRCLVTG